MKVGPVLKGFLIAGALLLIFFWAGFFYLLVFELYASPAAVRSLCLLGEEKSWLTRDWGGGELCQVNVAFALKYSGVFAVAATAFFLFLALLVRGGIKMSRSPPPSGGPR